MPFLGQGGSSGPLLSVLADMGTLYPPLLYPNPILMAKEGLEPTKGVPRWHNGVGPYRPLVP